jgi:NADH dehydrogenase [ubiquinone] 1 alpha subcomplex assembly factor 5
MATRRAATAALRRLAFGGRAPALPRRTRTDAALAIPARALAFASSSSSSSSSSATEFLDVDAAQARARARAAALAAKNAKDDGGMFVFDRAVVAAHRDRAAYARATHPSNDPTDPLLEEIARRTLDRLADVKRAFPRVLVLGGASDAVVGLLMRERADVETVVVTDVSMDMLKFTRARAAASFPAAGDGDGDGDDDERDEPAGGSLPSQTLLNKEGNPVRLHYVHADEECLPIKPNSVDVVVAACGLHWANDLPGAMTRARETLTPDGLFLASVFGGETMREMRIACAVGELEREGGVSQRVSPLARVRDCGNLLTRAGMTLPAVDVDTLTMRYPNVMKLIDHVRFMGEGNASASRRPGPVRRGTAAAVAAAYATMFPAVENESDLEKAGVEATFQVLYMTGWSPGEGQQVASERGSAGVSLSQLEQELEKVPEPP